MKYLIALAVFLAIMYGTGHDKTPLEQGVIRAAVGAFLINFGIKVYRQKDIVGQFLRNFCFIIPDDDYE